MSSKSRSVLALVLSLAAVAAAAACGSGDGPTPQDRPPLVVVENASQYVLEELRFHDTAQYTSAPNALKAPMTVGSTMSRYLDTGTFVTVFREKFRGGDLLALTTQTPIALEQGTGYRLKVFDASFRVVPEPYVPPPVATSSTSTTTR